MASDAQQIQAGRGGGGQVGLGHKVRLAQRLTRAQAAMDSLRVVPAGCRTPFPDLLRLPLCCHSDLSSSITPQRIL